MEHEPECTIEASNPNISHLSKQMETLSKSLREKEVVEAQLQSKLQTYQQVPEQLLKLIELMTEKAKLLQEAGYQTQQKEKEAALHKMKASRREDLERQIHPKHGKL